VVNIVEWLRLWAPSVSPKLDEAADYIEQLRKENQTQALDFLASEGEWWELIGKKDKEIEKLQEAYRLVRDSYEDTANEVARLRKRDGFINKLDEQIVTKDAEIERLRKEIHEYDDMIRDAGWYLTDDGGNSYKSADEIISHFLLAKDKARAEQNAALKEGE
jgi:predicted RNase H-like nuclease (RuvC/YqgF family)